MLARKTLSSALLLSFDYSCSVWYSDLNNYLKHKPVWETAVHLAVAGGVFDGVFCAVLFPTRCLG